ncbi:hypothetical protein KEM54_000766, partial [Ascosphaera aggregata]
SGGAGYSSSPFSTIHAITHEVFFAGDSIKLNSWTTCQGSLNPKGSDTKGNPIRLTSCGGSDPPTINGNGNMYASSLQQTESLGDDKTYAIVNPTASKSTKLGLGIGANGPQDTSCGIGVVGATGTSPPDEVQIHRSNFHDCGGGDIKVRVGQMYIRRQNIHVYNNTVSNVGKDGIIVPYAPKESPTSYNIIGYPGKG